MKPKHVKRAEAEERQKFWSGFSLATQLALLMQNGFGHTRQYKRIEAKLQPAPQAVVAPHEPKPERRKRFKKGRTQKKGRK